MACFSTDGLPPNPPRLWARVQSRCSTDVITERNPMVYIPTTNQLIPLSKASIAFQMLRKGNVLQYKKNSSDLTKNQRYSQIAKGKWLNRTTTFASQNILVTNPNTRSLKRVNYTTIYADDGTPANLPVTCPQPKVVTTPSQLPINFNPPNVPVVPNFPNNVLIANSVTDDTYPRICPQYVDPSLIVPIRPKKPIPKKLLEKKNPEREIKELPIIKPPIPAPEREVIPDGGSLVCVVEDICGNEAVSGQQQAYLGNNYCNPTSASDVPGPVMDLCYNDLAQTPYYPDSRRNYAELGNSWPTEQEIDMVAEEET